MKKKTWLFAALAAFGLVLTGCDGSSIVPANSVFTPAESSAAERDPEINRIYQLYVADGGTLSYEEWAKSIKGDPGKDGTSFRCGSGAPTSDLGVDGDSYVDQSTWDFYVKVNGSWIKSGNLMGAQGPQGEKGDKGDTGEQGPQGDKGDTGEQGPQGDKGDKGDTGEQGPQGEKGDKGDTGEQGPQGDKGDTGEKGDKGDAGEQGPQGDKGDTGEQGPQGNPGVSVVSIVKTGSEGLLDTYTITYSDGSTSTFVVANGAAGEQGIQGLPGEDGHSPQVTIGDNGDWFIDGKDTGLKAQGPKGDKGEAGENGADGKSAYEIYVSAYPEYQGDEQQWIDDLINGRLGDKQTFIVTFDLGYNGLSFTQSVPEGGKAKKPETPVRDGHDFLDWVDRNGEHWVFNGFTVTEDITLYARWSNPDEYSVTFVNNGGEVLEVGSYQYGDTAVYHGITPIPQNQDPHCIYTFLGWDKDLVVTGDMVFTAQYKVAHVVMTAYYYDYDGETLLATVPLTEGEAPHYDGAKPVRPRDDVNKLQFEFERWEKAEETESSAKFVAKYTSCTDGLDFEGNKVTKYHGTSTDVVIPSVWGGYEVTEIGGGAFTGSPVVSVVIPDSVTTIDGGWEVGGGAFSGCSSLVSVTIPDSVAFIGDDAFYGCSSLASVTIPSGVTSIGTSAFYGCKSLSSVTIPSSVTSIGGSAFFGCSSLSSVTIPDGVTSIRDYAFSGCSSLSSVIIPGSVTSIGYRAFSGCTSLVRVTFQSATPPAFYLDPFSGAWDKPLLRIYVPEEGLDAYKAVADKWHSYAALHIHAGEDSPEIVLTVEINGTPVDLAPEADPGMDVAVYKTTLNAGDKLVIKADDIPLFIYGTNATEFTCAFTGEHVIYVGVSYIIRVTEPVTLTARNVSLGTWAAEGQVVFAHSWTADHEFDYKVDKGRFRVIEGCEGLLLVCCNEGSTEIIWDGADKNVVKQTDGLTLGEGKLIYVEGNTFEWANKTAGLVSLARFEFGTDETKNPTHIDGMGISSGTYTEDNGEYTLNLSNVSNAYPDTYDAYGNACLRLGSRRSVGSFTVTGIPRDVNLVVFHIAGYKSEDGYISINGEGAELVAAHSNDGEYDEYFAVPVDGEITIATLSEGSRIMIAAIEFFA